jgi:hypothetical protein
MPKSKNRKDHKNKVAARNQRLRGESKKEQKAFQSILDTMIAKKEAEEAGTPEAADVGELVPDSDIVEVKTK